MDCSDANTLNLTKELEFIVIKRFLIFVFLLVSLAFAQDDKICRESLFTRAEALSLAKITAVPDSRAYFYNDFDNCPSLDTDSCREASYLIAGDELVVSKEYEGFSCAWYAGASETVGWLESDRLEPVQIKPPEHQNWLGHWQYNDNEIYLTELKFSDDFLLEALAIWQGDGANIHIAEVFERIYAPQYHSIQITTEDGCFLQLSIMNDYLAAMDNLKCGGANVSFNGIYKKAAE